MDAYTWFTIAILAVCAVIWIACQVSLASSKHKAEEQLHAGVKLESQDKYSEAVAIYCDALISAIENPDVEAKIVAKLGAIYKQHLPPDEFNRTQQLLCDVQSLSRAYQALVINRMESDNVTRCLENQSLKLDVLNKLPRLLPIKDA